jgi:glucose-specific phosphotransferase system IIA component
MKLFKHKNFQLLSPVSGNVVSITETPDKVFSDKVLGDGVTVIPDKNEVVSPVDGTVVQIARTLHAICIEADNHAEILLHLGIDTVELNGEGFTCCVKKGEHVSAGQKLMDMDIDFIKNRGYSTVSPCIITNMDYVKNLNVITGHAEAGKTVIITYEV